LAQGESVFERFTPPARQVVVHALDEARSLGHDHIGGEHLLLGLLHEEDGLAARVLGSLGITLEDARTHGVRPVGSWKPPATSQIPFTPGAKEALELSGDEADEMNHGFIGTEHVLLGLLGVGDEAVEGILAKLGSTPDRIRTRLLEMLSGSA
jgi:ATP-dependent Clp protease ATP-binding subunit ClpC